VTERADGADLVLPGAGIRADVTVRLSPDRCVGWRYRDPAGTGREVVNCSIADVTVRLTPQGGATQTFDGTTGAYEIGARSAALAVPLQPFDD
jgi:hypothetical protein